MSKRIERVEIITGRGRRERYIVEETVRLVEETMQPSMTVSAVARLHELFSVELDPPACWSGGDDGSPRVAFNNELRSKPAGLRKQEIVAVDDIKEF